MVAQPNAFRDPREDGGVPDREQITCANRSRAIALAKAGIPVFPVALVLNHSTGRWDKKPCIKGWRELATKDL